MYLIHWQKQEGFLLMEKITEGARILYGEFWQELETHIKDVYGNIYQKVSMKNIKTKIHAKFIKKNTWQTAPDMIYSK